MEAFFGLVPRYTPRPRIATIAFIFVAAAILHSPITMKTPPMNGGNSASTSFGINVINHSNHDPLFCLTNGSLHQLALDMFHYSSPPGSPSYKKLKHVLHINSDFFVNMGGGRGIFAKNEENMARMLDGYGLKQIAYKPNTPDDPQNVTLVETLFTNSVCPIEKDRCKNHARIFIQTEQYFKPHVLSCAESPNCIILDWSDFNYLKAKNQRKDLEKSFVLLPVMTQTPSSRLSMFEPAVPKPLKERSIDMVFFGEMTNRRNVLVEGKKAYLEANPGRQVVIKKNHQVSDVANNYQEAKVCLLAHSYSSKSAGETHRMSEFAPFGCIPVLENFEDKFGIDVYEKCGGAVFDNSTNLMKTAADIVAKIDQGLYNDRGRAIIDWWKTGALWERILPTVFGV